MKRGFRPADAAFQSRVVYCALLALGIYVSMLREQKKIRGGAPRSWPRRVVAIFGVWTFFATIWIWGVRGDATPWYPTMRLLRQPRHGHWDAVFEELIALVRGWARVRQREARRIATTRAKETRGTWS